jgi:tRNA/rRNA methyltransferase
LWRDDALDQTPNNPDKVFHSLSGNMRDRLHVVLVRPELGANVGSVCRAMANTGIKGRLRIVGAPRVIDKHSYSLAKHARDYLDSALHFADLRSALHEGLGEKRLSIASTARVGSAARPHPVPVREAAERATTKQLSQEVDDIVLVFGPEGDGLTNEDVQECDWVATIPASDEYRSLNLAQAVLIFCYEVNLALVDRWQPFVSVKPSQKGRLISHLVEVAEQVGFILPDDPHKMRPRLEQILLGVLPNHIEDVKTLHGLLDQIARSVKKGGPDFKGRFRREMIDRGILES